MKKFVLFFVMALLFMSGYGQNCDCLSNLKWLIKTFEQNDAGFGYVLEKKGETAYLTHNKDFIERAKHVKDKKECLKLLNDWTEFFRKNHLQVVLNEQGPNEDFFKNTPTVDLDIDQFVKTMDANQNQRGFEGIWYSAPYTIGIIKDNNSSTNREYVGFIVKSENPNWLPKQIKLEIYKNTHGGYTMKYYMGNHYPLEFKNLQLIEQNYLMGGFIVLKRLNSMSKPSKDTALFIESISARKPFVKKISDSTVLLRIPSFRLSAKQAIDSVLEQNKELILGTPYLIIDLRNNGGGSDQSYANIIPYLYTNPIRIVGLEFLSTKLNNQRMEKFINNPQFSEEEREWAKKSLEKLNRHLGEFVNLEENIVSIEELDTIYPYPKQVGILINEYCGSTTEQFLLAAKQSKKVKLFGKPTMGALDISNLNAVDSPCREYRLWYGLTRSYRIPEMAIDGIGIQPDFYFDKTIKPQEWIPKAGEILNYR